MNADYIDNKNDVVMGRDVYRSEEFKALCKRFNIPWELGTKDVVLSIPCEGVFVVTHSYQTRHPSSAIETTTVHNDDYRTFQPVVVSEKN